MKKSIILIVALILAIGLTGCGESSSAKSYDFEYKFKEEYSDSVSRELAASFISIVKKAELIYENVSNLEDFSAEEDLLEYLDEYFNPTLRTLIDNMKQNKTYSETDQELIEYLVDTFETTENLYNMKIRYELDQINEEMGLKPDNEKEYYIESSENFKRRFTEILDEAQIYID